MVTDAQTNTLYLADVLPRKFPRFYAELDNLLTGLNINIRLLPYSRDIWAVDYMPVQIDYNDFVQFLYNPDYLKPKKWHKTISNGALIAESLGITTKASRLILDGGNVVNSSNKVILCDKVLQENKSFFRLDIVSELKSIFCVDDVLFIPQQPGDFIGHADGMIRFIDDHTVLINDYSREKGSYQDKVMTAIKATGLDYVTLPYNPYQNRTMTQANGIYINYLQMKGLVVMPIYGMQEDYEAFRLMEAMFPDSTIATLDCNDIANHGGVLNCISWNIYVP